MVEVDVRQAKTHFSRLLARVETGEEVLILRAGRPVARLVSFRRKAGRDKGKGWIAADFNAPLPRKVRAAFYKRARSSVR